ncbi:sce7725 family protein [Lacticaseibacillus saniviri]
MNYYPLIRGKLYDLAALTELANQHLLSPRVVPILEPVKDLPGLVKTAKAFTKRQQPLVVITNPQVGTYGLLATPKHQIALTPPLMAGRYFDPIDSALTIAQTMAQARLLKHRPGIHVVPDEARVRQLRLDSAVYLNDHFTTWSHTADYAQLQDEFYQYPVSLLPGIGFSDYPITTGDYQEQGFAQRAIALHLVYVGPHNTLRLHHFVSVNNEDYQDPASKFFEAASQLEPWLAMHPEAVTSGLTQLITFYHERHFPALGTLRKLQLMHHLELIGRWLDDAI